MKQLLFALVAASFLSSCKKDDTIKIPVHPESLSWFVDASAYFTNGAGDTLYFTSNETGTQWLSNLADVIPNSGFMDTQSQYQNTTIDSSIRYQTNISAFIDSNNLRSDNLNLRFSYGNTELNFTGNAHPQNTINLDSGVFYLPVWQIHGREFQKVYGQEIQGEDHLVAYVNAEYNLVGFSINGQLYSLKI
jgi:hypothetical protein